MKIFCLKCQQSREIEEWEEIVLENGQSALEGICPVCGTKWLQVIHRNACQ